MEQTENRQQTVGQLRDSIEEQRDRIRRNGYTVQEAQEALSHHLEQLKKAGATLEDDICQLLRKTIELAEASQRLEELSREYELRTMRGEV